MSTDRAAEPPPVLVLAAGKGTRLGELGRSRPKVLVPIRGRPILDLHLDHLSAEGVRTVVVNAHHQADQLVQHAERYQGPLDVTVLVEPELLGTAGAAINALGALPGDTFLVLYGDVMIFEPLAPLLDAHRRAGADATLTVYEREDTRAKGVVEIDPDGRITSFAEKDPTRSGPGLVNAGLYVLERRVLEGFPGGSFLDFGQDVFPAAVQAGRHLQSYLIPEPVLDVGTPDDLARAQTPDA